MRKDYLRISEQIELLQQRGMKCNEHTAQTLMREGYYSIINGYGKPFLDHRASTAAGEDRFREGTTFADVYALFCFDRDLRMLTFSQLSRVENMIRTLASGSFLVAHPQPDSYLDKANYTTAHHYLLGEENFEYNMQTMLRTLEHFANTHEDHEAPRVGTRLAHYQQNYDSVPLWVVFTEFSYGNLYHFVALMQKDDQIAVCEHVLQALGGSKPSAVEGTAGEASQSSVRRQLSRKGLLDDMAFQLKVRNRCAHGERLYDMIRYDDFMQMMARYLTDEDFAAYDSQLRKLMGRYQHVLQPLGVEYA